MTEPTSEIALHQLVASDAYWENRSAGIGFLDIVTAFGPVTSMRNTRQSIRNLSEILGAYTATDRGQEISKYFFHAQAGVEVVPVEEGEPVPFPPENSRQIVKLVEDMRRVRPLHAIIEPITNDQVLQDFDITAAAMQSTVLYAGSDAKASIRTGDGFVTDIKRSVAYMRTNKAGNGFVILPAVLMESQRPDGTLFSGSCFPRRSMNVGEIYANPWDRKGWLRRVVSAEVLDPTGMNFPRARGNRKSPKREKVKSWGWNLGAKPTPA